MSWGLEFTLALVALVGLLISGLWVPFAIGLCGLVFLYSQSGFAGFKAVGLVTWGGMNSFTLTAVPLFVLMAEVVLRSGVSERFYSGLSTIVSRLPGGLLQTNIVGCAIFAAISGSSVATSASLGKVAIKSLSDRSYSPSLTCGTLAAGGTLGILIPPSIVMILYGELADTSIARLFMAGLLPGIGLAVIFVIFIAVLSWLRPSIAPAERETFTRDQIARSWLDILPIVVLIGTVLGGIYAGVMTPTEAAGVGSAMAMVVARLWGKFDRAMLWAALRSSVTTSATILFIVMAAYIFSYAAEVAGVGRGLSSFIIDLGLDRTTFLIVLIVFFALLGCVMDTIAMMMLTLPLLLPVLVGYDFDLIWFGVLMVLLLELGQITPPLGINLFVIQSMSPWKLGTVVKGSVPFWGLIVGYIGLLSAFPEIATWLPSTMKNW